jgi:hypothetical protein
MEWEKIAQIEIIVRVCPESKLTRSVWPEVFWPQGEQGQHLTCPSNRPASGASEWATEESVFANVLATRSFPHLRLMFRVFRSVTGRDIEAVIDQHFSGKLRKGFLSIGKHFKF